MVNYLTIAMDDKFKPIDQEEKEMYSSIALQSAIFAVTGIIPPK